VEWFPGAYPKIVGSVPASVILLTRISHHSFFAVLLSPVLDGFDQLIKLYCTVLAVN